MRRKQIPEYGIEIIEGLPGSGKTLMCVRRCLDVIETQRRPVYTNLPLRWRVVREYLRNRGGPNVAGLIRPLTREGFMRFLDRFNDYAACVEAWKAEAKLAGRVATSKEIERRWFEKAGANVIEGEDANWIPPGSVVVLDEVHSWFSMQEQSRETPGLQRYLTMHRHMCHWVWAVAQDRATLSITFRRFAMKLWRVRDMRQDKLAWGMRFGHLGVHAIGYSCYTGDQIGGRTMDDDTPRENYVLLPWLPQNSRFFRFYDGFSHVGKVGSLVRQMEDARVASGLSRDGSDVADERVADFQKREKERKGRTMKRALRLVRWMLRRVIGWSVVALLAFAVGAMVAGSKEGGGVAGAGDVATGTVASSTGVASGGEGATDAAPVKWPRWEGAGRGYVRIDGQRVERGGKVGEATIVYIEDRPRALLLERGGDIWLWKWGEPEPRRVGPVDQVAGIVEARRAALARSRREPVPAESSGGGVGAPEGDVLGE